MGPNPVDRQHSQGKQYPAAQLGNFKNILKACRKPFKHGQSPWLAHRPFQFSEWQIH